MLIFILIINLITIFYVICFITYKIIASSNFEYVYIIGKVKHRQNQNNYLMTFINKILIKIKTGEFFFNYYNIYYYLF